MPIFDYVCDKCGVEQERIVKYRDNIFIEDISCNSCGEKALIRKPPIKLNFRLKGKWFKNGGY
jgi:putative FmdB family regulatory protein